MGTFSPILNMTDARNNIINNNIPIFGKMCGFPIGLGLDENID
jgi:hypothetical protein